MPAHNDLRAALSWLIEESAVVAEAGTDLARAIENARAILATPPVCERCDHTCPTDGPCPTCGGDPMVPGDRLCADCDGELLALLQVVLDGSRRL